MLAASHLTNRWEQALLLVQPATLLRWHRELFHRWWTWRSRPRRRLGPRLRADTISVVRTMAAETRLWGAERIRGELLKLGLRVCKRTVQKYMRSVRPQGPSSPQWQTFLTEHAKDIWACDFLQLYDAWFRHIFAFFLVDHATRRVIQVGVTRSPCDAWIAQQLRNATPNGEGPRFLIRDRDAKFGKRFDRAVSGVGIEIPTVHARPGNTDGRVVAAPVLGGLHHAYHRAA